MDVDEFIALERLRLRQERDRLFVSQRLVEGNAQQISAAIIPANKQESPIATCPAEQLLESPHFQPTSCSRRTECADSHNTQTSRILEKCIELPHTNGAKEHPANTMPSIATDERDECASMNECAESSEATFMMYAAGGPETHSDNTAEALVPVNFHLDLSGVARGEEVFNDSGTNVQVMEKSAKDLVNRRELLAGNSVRSATDSRVKQADCDEQKQRPLSENVRQHRNKDDMEQWVTDTFYSYFPGFNNENQKRQNYLRERQRENQQNFLKHQMLNPPLSKHAAALQKSQQKPSTHFQNNNLSTARSATSSTSNNTTTSTTDKTDLEIIVNNPNYVPPKHIYSSGGGSKTKPGTARHKLLQDLGHVELSNIVTGDGIMERNMRSAELETARKRDYQRDLMQQIDEKRRSIELLREKERKQEEALTRRLEAQLKAMKLEEQLEKERMRAEKARIDSEHNRMMREHLLAKLENDKKLLNAKQTPTKTKQMSTAAVTNAAGTKNINTTASNANHPNTTTNRIDNKDNNKVYKYFSNSARHEYRRGQPLPADVEFELEIPEMSRIERECFHLCEKICPLCDEPLKSYESCCLRCQRKLALKMKGGTSRRKKRNGIEKATVDGGDIDANAVDNVEEEEDDLADEDDDGEGDGDHILESCRSTYALVCLKCERLYALCATCLAKSDVCRACHRKRNVCMNCRRTLCSFCLEEIACGRDTERMHINEKDDAVVNQGKADAFRVLELNYTTTKDSDNMESPPPPTPPRTYDNQLNYTQIHNKLDEESSDGIHEQTNQPPYSMNITRNSVFHPEYKPVPTKSVLAFEQLPNISDRQLSFDLDSSATDEQANIERVRRETDKRLARYLKNYGDLAEQQRSRSESRNRSTQTTPVASGRRDVVMHETTHNLSMPLLREMPKMTRNESSNLLAQTALNNRRKIDNLKRRWEVPAVQKFTVTSNSPKVLTQVGAIRKQLQAERFCIEEDY